MSSKAAYDLASVIDAGGLSHSGNTYRSEGKADSPRLVGHKKPKERKHGEDKTTNPSKKVRAVGRNYALLVESPGTIATPPLTTDGCAPARARVRMGTSLVVSLTHSRL